MAGVEGVLVVAAAHGEVALVRGERGDRQRDRERGGEAGAGVVDEGHELGDAHRRRRGELAVGLGRDDGAGRADGGREDRGRGDRELVDDAKGLERGICLAGSAATHWRTPCPWPQALI